MSKRTTFTSITPLPPGLTRESVIAFLHNHQEMIDLNPLVIERHPIPAPPHAEPEERGCVWYSITDKISYFPGVTGETTYSGAFHDLPGGLQTHVYAPMGLEIRDKWSVGGSLPGEPAEPQELGIGAPVSGLYLREDVDFRCNVLIAGFVKKQIKKSHGTLVEALSVKAQAQLREEQQEQKLSSHYDGEEKHPLRHNPTFISSGANQGQPGQGDYSDKPYQVPGLYETPSAELEGSARWQSNQ